MAGLFIAHFVDKCTACQSHWKSDFGWHRFQKWAYSLALAWGVRGLKSLKRFWNTVLMTFRSSISTGKPEQLLSLMCLFFRFPEVERIVYAMICNGNRTEWSPIRSVIIRVINKIGRPRSRSQICLITSMITDRIGRHEVLLPINHNCNKICDIIGYFLNQNTRNSKFCFASSEKKKPFKRARDGAHSPIT